LVKRAPPSRSAHIEHRLVELNLSAKYFGDLVKRKTGQTAQDYIQSTLINVAKEMIFDLSKTAFELGFKYPQHFSRLFKQRVGQTPNEYRMLNNLN
jgi:AraC family transcriptional activator of pobA